LITDDPDLQEAPLVEINFINHIFCDPKCYS
jgi:hypothetical protein